VLTPPRYGCATRTVNCSTAGTDGAPDSKCTISTTGDYGAVQACGVPVPVVCVGRKSLCTAFDEKIKALLDKGLSAQRIFQDLSLDDGFSGSYRSKCLSLSDQNIGF
jgi:hypothetical protein